MIVVWPGRRGPVFNDRSPYRRVAPLLQLPHSSNLQEMLRWARPKRLVWSWRVCHGPQLRDGGGMAFMADPAHVEERFPGSKLRVRHFLPPLR